MRGYYESSGQVDSGAKHTHHTAIYKTKSSILTLHYPTKMTIYGLSSATRFHIVDLDNPLYSNSFKNITKKKKKITIGYITIIPKTHFITSMKMLQKYHLPYIYGEDFEHFSILMTSTNTHTQKV